MGVNIFGRSPFNFTHNMKITLFSFSSFGINFKTNIIAAVVFIHDSYFEKIVRVQQQYSKIFEIS